VDQFNHACSGRLANFSDCQGKPVPVRLFYGELPLASPGQPVEFGAASGLVHFPPGPYPSAIFDSVESGVERALFDLEQIIGDLAQALDDAIAVKRAKRQRFEYQQVKRPL